MRPFSFITSVAKHDKRIRYDSRYDYSDWVDQYEKIYSDLSLNKKIFFIVENTNSQKNGFVGYLDNVDDLPHPDSIRGNCGLWNHYKNDMYITVHDEKIKVMRNWLLPTSETECSSVRRAPIKFDKFGTPIESGMFAVWSNRGDIRYGTVSRIADLTGAIYVKEFNGEYEKNIRYPSQELIVLSKNVDIFSKLVKLKLKSR